MEATLYLMIIFLIFMSTMYFIEVYQDAKLRKKVIHIEDRRKNN